MADRAPRYALVWSGSFSEVQDLPKPLKRGLRLALSEERDMAGRFLVQMGRLLRFCGIGHPVRRRARLAASAALSEQAAIDSCFDLSRTLSLAFSSAFRKVRYRERHVWTAASDPNLAIILARDDLESLSQALLRGTLVPDLFLDPAVGSALRGLRQELDDHIQTIEALHDGVLDGLMAQALGGLPPDDTSDFLGCLAPVEPVRWWLAVYLQSFGRQNRA